MLKKLSLYAIAFIGLTVIFSSCKKEYESIETLDEQNIEEYIAKNNIQAERDPSGFYYQIIDEGSGETVNNSDSVYYSFDFKHTSNVSFAKNSDYLISGNFLGYTDRFTLGGSSFLLTPVRLTLSKLKRGGSARVIIPSRMIFGKNGNTNLGVASNEVIVVDLKLFAETKQWQIDELLIDKYVAANNLDVVKDPSRVRYIIGDSGDGNQLVSSTSTITANYIGRLLDGTQFDPIVVGANSTITSTLNDLIKGWGDVIPGKLTKGGTIRLIIPSDRAYGSAGSNGIPGNSAISFEIQITDVVN